MSAVEGMNEQESQLMALSDNTHKRSREAYNKAAEIQSKIEDQHPKEYEEIRRLCAEAEKLRLEGNALDTAARGMQKDRESRERSAKNKKWVRGVRCPV